jgi:dihydrofolate reductase/effector-binding domain-containing protein
MSRTVIADVVMTLDGRTTGPDGAGDMSVIAPHGVSEEARDKLVEVTHATTALLGRKNYEGFAGWWPAVATMPEADTRDREFSRWLTSVEKIVFSRTLSTPVLDNTTIVDRDPADVVTTLREQPGGPIRVQSSVSIIRRLLQAGLIDRLELTISPEIVGPGGELLFDPDTTGRSSWQVVDQTLSGSGAVLLTLDHVEHDDERTLDTTEIRELPEQRTVYLRETVPTENLTEFQSRAFAAIWATLQAARTTSTQHPYMRCHAESGDTMDVEVGLPVHNEDFSGPALIGSLPGGPALVHTHHGSHATLGDAYAALDAAPTDGLTRTGARWEVYRWCDFHAEPNPATWPLPDDWTTLLVQPLAAGGDA